MTRCHVCMDPLPTGTYHEPCLVDLFGVPRAPFVDVDLARLQTLALSMVGRSSLSGAQRKISATLDDERATLSLAIEGGLYILKPQASAFEELPEIEWVTQRLAACAGIEVPPAGLVALADGTRAYVVRRFDRDPGGKLAMEDFCQLAELPPAAKYDGSAELCGRIVDRYASQPLVELLRLFRQLVFNWWVGNGDLHLKNLALLRGPDGLHRLSPAYDQVATRLVIADDPLALPVGGKRDNLKRSTWLTLARTYGLGPRAADRVLSEIAAGLENALAALTEAPLSPGAIDTYCRTLRQRTATLAG